MIRHLVFWKLKEENKVANAREIKSQIEQLKGKIPGLLHIEIGVNHPEASASNWDIVLHCDFENMAALEAYQVHPEHQKVAKFIGAVRTDRACVDYETV